MEAVEGTRQIHWFRSQHLSNSENRGGKVKSFEVESPVRPFLQNFYFFSSIFALIPGVVGLRIPQYSRRKGMRIGNPDRTFGCQIEGPYPLVFQSVLVVANYPTGAFPKERFPCYFSNMLLHTQHISKRIIDLLHALYLLRTGFVLFIIQLRKIINCHDMSFVNTRSVSLLCFWPASS